jgi:hypothetical protein
MKDVVAVTPFTNKQAWSLQIKSPKVTVKAKRTQVPLVCLQPSKLHVLQRCTTDPGVIFHWKFPRRLSPQQQKSAPKYKTTKISAKIAGS